jgi:hypothetical protein
MTGCIQVAQMLDPDVTTIHVLEAGEPDITYQRVPNTDEWTVTDHRYHRTAGPVSLSVSSQNAR